MRAVITVIGKDAVGILAKVSNECFERNVNIVDVNQSVLQDLFAMIMLSDVSACNIPFSQFVKKMTDLGKANGLSVHVMHEEIFDSMHKV